MAIVIATEVIENQAAALATYLGTLTIVLVLAYNVVPQGKKLLVSIIYTNA